LKSSDSSPCRISHRRLGLAREHTLEQLGTIDLVQIVAAQQ
jgi:hypothetical protein